MSNIKCIKLNNKYSVKQRRKCSFLNLVYLLKIKGLNLFLKKISNSPWKQNKITKFVYYEFVSVRYPKHIVNKLDETYLLYTTIPLAQWLLDPGITCLTLMSNKRGIPAELNDTKDREENLTVILYQEDKKKKDFKKQLDNQRKIVQDMKHNYEKAIEENNDFWHTFLPI